MPPVQQLPGAPQQSVTQKLMMGATMGTGVGLCIGFIGGAFQILRAGPGPKGAMATLAQFMGTSAATFGFFMSIGTVIRTEPSSALEYAHVSPSLRSANASGAGSVSGLVILQRERERRRGRGPAGEGERRE